MGGAVIPEIILLTTASFMGGAVILEIILLTTASFRARLTGLPVETPAFSHVHGAATVPGRHRLRDLSLATAARHPCVTVA